MNDPKNDSKAKQQIVDKVKSSTNILVTVSNSPSVDALSAALGLTVMLNDLGKHATAVFSGTVPSAMEFLEPNKTFENTTDSLRDFIIALNKEKADHLRYKVDGDVVKIFITPYRTTINSDDLEFSQGDYNVELVLALGVENQDHLDAALEAHGRILHDATVATISAGEAVSQLGSIDWSDPQASSLSEMLVTLADGLKTDKPVLDGQIATAFLTGIVAATDRFSNNRTTSRVMTLAAQLMAAGADQQLIAAKLQEGHEINTMAGPSNAYSIESDAPAAVEPKDDGNFSIAHDKNATLEDITNEVKAQEQAEAAQQPEIIETEVAPAPTPEAPAVETPPIAEVEPAPVAEPTPAATPVVEMVHERVIEPLTDMSAPPEPIVTPADIVPAPSVQTPDVQNDVPETVTIADAYKFDAEDSAQVEPQAHSYLGAAPTYAAPMNGSDASETGPAVASVYDTLAAEVAPEPTASLPLPPPLPDFSALPQPPPLPDFAAPPAVAPAEQPERLGDIFAPETPAAAPLAPPAPTANDPAQFQIPGQ
jgi:hypothetical protein